MTLNHHVNDDGSIIIQACSRQEKNAPIICHSASLSISTWLKKLFFRFRKCWKIFEVFRNITNFKRRRNMARAWVHKPWFAKASNQVYGNKILFLLNFSIMWWKEGRAYGTYTGAKNVWGGWFLAGNDNNHKNWVPFILPHNLCLIFMRMKQFFFFFEKKIKMANSKKLRFSNPPNLNTFSRQFQGLVLG